VAADQPLERGDLPQLVHQAEHEDVGALGHAEHPAQEARHLLVVAGQRVPAHDRPVPQVVLAPGPEGHRSVPPGLDDDHADAGVRGQASHQPGVPLRELLCGEPARTAGLVHRAEVPRAEHEQVTDAAGRPLRLRLLGARLLAEPARGRAGDLPDERVVPRTGEGGAQ
jgi:hypothetical protein